MGTPKPHQHADAIKAWADGAKIQLKTKSGEWVDVAANWPCWSVNYEYRVKPEEPSKEPWKPKKGEEYNYFSDDGFLEWTLWNDTQTDIGRYGIYNCFRTKEEAEAAAERVKAALKGTTDVSANVGSNVGSEIDGKPFTDGEKALIKAIRAVKIARIAEYRTSVLCFPSENTNTVQVWCSDTPIAFLTSSLGSISKDKAIIDALKQIKAEQEAE